MIRPRPGAYSIPSWAIGRLVGDRAPASSPRREETAWVVVLEDLLAFAAMLCAVLALGVVLWGIWS
jgi:hypothetical protein